MTATWVLVLAGVALVIAVAAVVVAWPRPPDMDEERWLKIMLATVFRGEAEAAGGGVEAWEALARRWVPWHPAGRLPELKITRPEAFDFPGASLEGEVALVEALARRSDPAARWARLYDEDEAALDALLADPADLGPSYDPQNLLGPGGGWDDLAAWGGGGGDFATAVHRALDARWLLVDGAPGPWPAVLDALVELLGERAVRVPWQGEEGVEAVGAAFAEVAPRPGDRVVVVAAAEGALVALRALAADAGKRDHLAAFCAAGGVLGGWPDRDGPWGRERVEDWMAVHFSHAALDTEASRRTPYLALQWLDRAHQPPGAAGLPLQAQRFPRPRLVPGAITYLDPVDLGPLPLDDELPVAAVGKALVAAIASAALART